MTFTIELEEDPPEIHDAYVVCPHHVDEPWNHHREHIGHTWGNVRVQNPETGRLDYVREANGCIRVGWTYTNYDNETCRYEYQECTMLPRPTACLCYDCEHSEDGRGNGECQCGDCRARRREDSCSHLINSYSYKPIPIFHGVGPTYLGVELELEGDAYDAAEPVCQLIGNRAYLKEDGSVDGFELVTHPHTLESHVNDFHWQAVLNQSIDSGMQATSNCGLHVHVSRDAFSSPGHAFRWQSLLYRNQRAVTRVARRNSTQWARWPSQDNRRDEMLPLSKGIKGPDIYGGAPLYLERYRALNFQNQHTVELRIFASTTDYGELMSALELVTASVEYTRQLPTQPREKALSLPAFREYAETNKYAHLAHVL